MLAAANHEHSDPTTVYGILARETLRKIRAERSASSDSLNRFYRSSIFRMIDAYLFDAFSTENRSGIVGDPTQSPQLEVDQDSKSTSVAIKEAFEQAHLNAFPQKNKHEAMEIVRRVTISVFSEDHDPADQEELEATIAFFESLIQNLTG